MKQTYITLPGRWTVGDGDPWGWVLVRPLFWVLYKTYKMFVSINMCDFPGGVRSWFSSCWLISYKDFSTVTCDHVCTIVHMCMLIFFGTKFLKSASMSIFYVSICHASAYHTPASTVKFMTLIFAEITIATLIFCTLVVFRVRYFIPLQHKNYKNWNLQF